jgi:hypothetical protein
VVGSTNAPLFYISWVRNSRAPGWLGHTISQWPLRLFAACNVLDVEKPPCPLYTHRDMLAVTKLHSFGRSVPHT